MYRCRIGIRLCASTGEIVTKITPFYDSFITVSSDHLMRLMYFHLSGACWKPVILQNSEYLFNLRIFSNSMMSVLILPSSRYISSLLFSEPIIVVRNVFITEYVNYKLHSLLHALPILRGISSKILTISLPVLKE